MTETFRPGAHVGVAARRPRAFSTLRRTLVAAEQIGLRAVLVRAMDEHAGGFFRRYGFQSATDERLTLRVPLQAVRRQLLGS